MKKVVSAVGAVAVVGVVLAAAPATASRFGTCNGNGPGYANSQGGGIGMGQGMGQRMGQGMGQGMGWRRGAGEGFGLGGGNLPTGTLSDSQKADLAANAEEEKLAHDVYTTLNRKYPSRVFRMIARSEQRHLDAVRSALQRYGLEDPTTGKALGEFASPDKQAEYSDLVASATSARSAWQVGVTIEQEDLQVLAAASQGLDAPDVEMLYSHLTMASQHHLAAFQNQL